MEKEEAIKFFNNIKPKYLKEFEAITPKKNNIKGFICKKPNRFLGSLLITEINGKTACQFVQSMPKIHYYNHKGKGFRQDNQCIIGYEKLDGSCLILYGLYDPDTGELLEIIPKSRNLPVADKVLLDMYRYIDDINIKEYFKLDVARNSSLMFELYGMLNRHEIYYYQTYIDIKLIGVYESGVFYTGNLLSNFALMFGFKTPCLMFTLMRSLGSNEWYIAVHNDGRLSPYMEKDDMPYLDVYDCIQSVKEKLYSLNYKYAENNGHRAVEGVVFNAIDDSGTQRYIKVKPRDIENEHKTVNGVPRRAIVKECYKYFDEYGSIVKDIYDEDDTHYIGYISNQLLEEYPEEIIRQPKVQNKISKVFMEVWDSKTVPESIQNICHKLVDENPDLEVKDLMRLFSQEYPQKKKMASTVYQVISSIKMRCNNG